MSDRATVAGLIRDAAAEPAENTRLAVLADALDELHPDGRDGRAMILRLYHDRPELRDPSFRTIHSDGHSEPFSGNGLVTNGQWLSTNLQMLYHAPHPVFTLLLQDRDSLKHSSAVVGVDHETAREIADYLPKPQKWHKLLDRHFGPDTRQKLTDELNRTLKPKEN